MKITLITFTLAFLTINISANENWIKIEPLDNTRTTKLTTKPNINLAQIQPINKMLKNATVIKQLIDVVSKKEKPTTNEKNWFVLNAEEQK